MSLYYYNKRPPKPAWCIVKSVAVKDRNNKELCRVPFGMKVSVLRKGKEKHYISVFLNGLTIIGHVPSASLAFDPVLDMARLPFINIMKRQVPTFIRYNGKRYDWISPGDTVSAIALCGEMCLTSKGWTSIKWLRKSREINDPGCIRTVAIAVIQRAIKDYRLIVGKIRKKRYRGTEEFLRIVNDMQVIREWFLDGYQRMFEDKVSGEERLMMIDHELKITQDWLDNQYNERDRIVGRKTVKK